MTCTETSDVQLGEKTSTTQKRDAVEGSEGEGRNEEGWNGGIDEEMQQRERWRRRSEACLYMMD